MKSWKSSTHKACSHFGHCFSFVNHTAVLDQSPTDQPPVAYPLSSKVTIDGKYTNPSEWNDTTSMRLEAESAGHICRHLTMSWNLLMVNAMQWFTSCLRSKSSRLSAWMLVERGNTNGRFSLTSGCRNLALVYRVTNFETNGFLKASV